MQLSLLTLLLAATSALAMPTDAAARGNGKGVGNGGAGNGSNGAANGGGAAAQPGTGNNGGGAGTGGAGAITASVVPDFGVTPGVKSTSQPGSCVGDQNKNIPCTCPPSKDTFAKTLSTFVSRGKAGNTPITFSTNFADQSKGTNLARINAMINTMQNLDFDKTGAAGRGCPVVAAPGLINIQKQLQAGQAVKIGQ